MYRLEPYELELKSTPKGREILTLIMTHIDEVSNLINHNREVMVTWQRNKGALFFSQFMASGFETKVSVSKEVGGIRLSSLIRRMAAVLQDYGSPSLVSAIDQCLLPVLNYAETSDSLQYVFQKLREL